MMSFRFKVATDVALRPTVEQPTLPVGLFCFSPRAPCFLAALFADAALVFDLFGIRLVKPYAFDASYCPSVITSLFSVDLSVP